MQGDTYCMLLGTASLPGGRWGWQWEFPWGRVPYLGPGGC